MGIASTLTRALLSLAREQGARKVYVSSTPSRSAVEFYRSFGFRIAREPIPELYALEPDDIHMVLDLAPVHDPVSA
jgi:ribosomal protein S18 acetylase RimI-like enzyme